MIKRVTLKDIAKETGFTINTVSRALRNYSDISDHTKKLIMKKAKEMGYVPNNLAGALRSGKTKTIAIILGDISNPYFAITVKELEVALNKNKYNTILINTNEDIKLEEKAIYSALSKNVDGIILFPTQRNIKPIKILKDYNIPFVLLGRHFKDEETDYVITDDIKGGYLATDYLIKKGKRKILFLNGPPYISAAYERLSGYKMALNENNIKEDRQLIKEIPITAEDCYKFIKNIMNEKITFDSVFAFNDVIALETIYLLQKMKYKIPQDIIVVGYDNIQSRLRIPIPLTSVNIPKKRMAIKAVEILLKKISSKNKSKYYREIFDVKLIIRK